MGVAAKNWIGATGAPPAGDLANAVLSGSFSAVGPSPAFGFQGWANISIWCAYNSALTVSANSLAASVAAIGSIAAGEAINSSVVPAGTTVAALTGGNNFTLALPTLTLYGQLLSNGQIIGMPSTKWLLGATVAGPNIPTGTTVTAIITPAVLPPSFPGGAQTLGIVQLSALPTGSLPAVNTPVAFTFALAAAGIAAGTDNSALFTGADIGLANSQINLERSFDGGLTWTTANIGNAGALATWGSGPINLAWMEPERGVQYRLNCVQIGSASGVTLNYRMSQTAGAASVVFTGGVV